MKSPTLLYHQMYNYGDDLNTPIWDHFLDGCLDGVFHRGTDEEAFKDKAFKLVTGIGTILDTRIPEHCSKTVLGSGTGYGPPPKHIDDSWHIAFVRGPLTAKALGLEEDIAITDPAILLAAMDLDSTFGTPVTDGPKIGYMPHHDMANDVVESVIEDTGLLYIDPVQSCANVLGKIRGLDLLIAEAMHGAITADTLRIPWIATSSFPNFNYFKWQDWGASLNMDINIHVLPALWPEQKQECLKTRLARRVRSHLFKKKLTRLALTASQNLSADTIFNSRLDQTLSAVEKTKALLQK